jgi:hypothetical protein
VYTLLLTVFLFLMRLLSNMHTPALKFCFLLQTLQCIALISSNSHPARVAAKSGRASFLQVDQLTASLQRIKVASAPALQSLYASGMFFGERQSRPLQTSFAARSTLIIMPSSILHQWEKELSDWAPFLDVFVFQGSDVHKNREVALSKLLTCDVALISCTTVFPFSRLFQRGSLLICPPLQGPLSRMSTGELGTTYHFAMLRPATRLPCLKFIFGASSLTRRSISTTREFRMQATTKCPNPCGSKLRCVFTQPTDGVSAALPSPPWMISKLC